jgi:hypothetical protein
MAALLPLRVQWVLTAARPANFKLSPPAHTFHTPLSSRSSYTRNYHLHSYISSVWMFRTITQEVTTLTHYDALGSRDKQEIGGQAVWSLSSAKPGFGVEQLRDDNIDTYWQYGWMFLLG